MTILSRQALNDVAHCPPYIQWAFDQDANLSVKFWVDGKDKNSISNRFEFALFGFRQLINKEMTMIDRWTKDSLGLGNTKEDTIRLISHRGFSCRMPMVDVFLKSMPRFLTPMERTVARLANKHRFNRPENEWDSVSAKSAMTVIELIDTAAEWIDCSEDNIEFAKKRFSDVPEDWEIIFEYSKYQNQKLFDKYDDFITECESVLGL